MSQERPARRCLLEPEVRDRPRLLRFSFPRLVNARASPTPWPGDPSHSPNPKDHAVAERAITVLRSCVHMVHPNQRAYIGDHGLRTKCILLES